MKVFKKILAAVLCLMMLISVCGTLIFYIMSAIK